MNERCQSPLRIVKVGGSLFDLKDLPERLAATLAEPGDHQACSHLLITGGGALADGVRRYDAVFPLSAAESHDVAVETMFLMARLLAAATGWPIVSSVAEAEEVRTGHGTAILDVRPILASVEPAAKGLRLRRSWDVTSDSIAARFAKLLNANELWLLKSVSVDPADGAARLVEAGIVDQAFPRYATGLRWRIQNLRDV